MKTAIWVLGATGLFVGGMLLLAAAGLDYTHFRPGRCLPDHCFCEAVRWGAAIRQPANTWSNLGFVAIGAAILSRGPREAYGWIVVFLGVGSAIFHATLTFPGQWLDLMSMFFLPTYFILLNLSARPIAVYWLVVNAILGVQLIWLNDGRWVFAGLLVILLLTEGLIRRRRRQARPARWLAAAFGVMAAAYGIWILDGQHLLCAPSSLLQGHAAWHLLSAVAAGCLYRYYMPKNLPGPAVPTTIA